MDLSFTDVAKTDRATEDRHMSKIIIANGTWRHFDLDITL